MKDKVKGQLIPFYLQSARESILGREYQKSKQTRRNFPWVDL